MAVLLLQIMVLFFALQLKKIDMATPLIKCDNIADTAGTGVPVLDANIASLPGKSDDTRKLASHADVLDKLGRNVAYTNIDDGDTLDLSDHALNYNLGALENEDVATGYYELDVENLPASYPRICTLSIVAANSISVRFSSLFNFTEAQEQNITVSSNIITLTDTTPVFLTLFVHPQYVTVVSIAQVVD